jgi:hypothetical protein
MKLLLCVLVSLLLHGCASAPQYVPTDLPPTEATSAAGDDRPDPPSGLVSAEAERNVKQLIDDVEQDLATGRACQAFVEKNGLVP